jgi:hypothetical protein
MGSIDFRIFGPFSDGLLKINARTARAPENVKFTGMLDLHEMPFIYAAADISVPCNQLI